MDWSAWSQESVAIMAARNRAVFAEIGAAYSWELENATFTLGERVFRLVVVGTVTADTFLWGWANQSLPAATTAALSRVVEFGREHDMALLVDPTAPGGMAQGKECLAVAGRILDASAAFISQNGTQLLMLLFADQ